MQRLRESLRFSLGELLLVALGAGVGMAALRSGGLLAAAYLFGTVVLLAWALVAAIVGREALQAFAIGFLVGVAVYGGVLYWYGDSEFDPERGELLTSRAAEPVYDVVSEAYYIDVYSGREADTVEAGAAATRGLVPMSYWEPSTVDVPFGSIKVAKVGNTFWSPNERPVRREFMQVFHLLAALTLGYFAGKFAAATYRGRIAPPAPIVRESESYAGEPNSLAPAAETGSRR
jgi:hypothetical protein